MDSTMVGLSTALQCLIPRCPSAFRPMVKTYPPSTRNTECVEEKQALTTLCGSWTFF